MKKRIILLLSTLGHLSHFAQVNNGTAKGVDFIINIDGEIAKTIYQPKITVLNSDREIKPIPVLYHPGDLSLHQSDLDYLLSLDDSTQLTLTFEYYQYTPQGNQHVINYEFEIGKNWLEQA